MLLNLTMVLNCNIIITTNGKYNYNYKIIIIIIIKLLNVITSIELVII